MWIGSTFIVMVGLYLGWSLIKGRIVLVLPFYFHPERRIVDRAERPKTFWAVWAATAAGLAVFTYFFIQAM